MGGSRYDEDVYSARVNYHSSTGTSPFKHDANIKSGKVATGVHTSLDPSKLNAAGKNVRESFDSDIHPDSVAVAVVFDETGSMGGVPKAFQKKLDKLMSVLVKKGYLEHPHVLFGGFGDATTDTVPLQIGQFEGGNEMDEALSNIYLEGNGGGQTTESSELVLYYMARHTDLDCFNKRGKKGYLFISTDETPYARVKKTEVKRFIGDDLQEDIPLEDILAEAQEKFEVFLIRPDEGSYTNDSRVTPFMKKLFGQNWLSLERADDIVELIALTIGATEGYDIHDVASGLKDAGADPAAIDRSGKALAAYVGNRGLTTKGAVEGNLPAVAGSDDVSRL